MKTKGLTIAALGIFFLLSFSVGSVQAANTITLHFHHVFMSFPVVNPCTGASGVANVTVNEVVHETNDTNGGMHFTGTTTGSGTEYDNDGINYTGHFESWFGGSVKPDGHVVSSATFHLDAVGTDGSALKYHANAHVTISSNGVLISNVTNAFCH